MITRRTVSRVSRCGQNRWTGNEYIFEVCAIRLWLRLWSRNHSQVGELLEAWRQVTQRWSPRSPAQFQSGRHALRDRPPASLVTILRTRLLGKADYLEHATEPPATQAQPSLSSIFSEPRAFSLPISDAGRDRREPGRGP
jgi:hypothetical protein